MNKGGKKHNVIFPETKKPPFRGGLTMGSLTRTIVMGKHTEDSTIMRHHYEDIPIIRHLMKSLMDLTKHSVIVRRCQELKR